MSHRPAERLKIFNEVVTLSTAASVNSQTYDMSDAYKITFVVGAGTAAASTALVATITGRQAVDEAAVTSTTIASATGTLMGPSTAFQVEGAKVGLITMDTTSTTTETINLTVAGNSYTLTYVGESSLVSTVATALAFGSSVGSSAAGGLEAAMNSLSSVINNSTLSKWLIASTPSTDSVSVAVSDSAVSTGFSILTTGDNITPQYSKSQSIIEILAEDMNAPSKYAYVALSSAATAVQCSITVIKEGMRQMPPTQVGQHVKST